MKLSKIKESITEYLEKTSIDDFYADPLLKSIKKLFVEITGLNTDGEISTYLHERFPETSIEAFKTSKLKEIKSLNTEVKQSKKNIEDIRNEVNRIYSKIKQIQDKLNNVPQQVNQLNTDLSEIEIEINQITPLSTKPPYDKQLEELKNKRIQISNSLENLPIMTANLGIELREETSLLNVKKETIDKNQMEQTKKEELINDLNNEIDQLENENLNHFSEEFKALKFFFNILLQKDIDIEHEYLDKNTGKKINDIYGYQSDAALYEVEKIIESNFSFEEVKNTIQAHIKNKNIAPSNWRKILLETVSKLTSGFTGRFNTSTYTNENTVIQRAYFALKPVDISAILAIKVALKTNNFLSIEDNKIALALFGGVMAIISLRVKGELVGAFQQKEVELYFNTDYSYDSKQTLYYQVGYANSEIQIEIPKPYYILSEQFVIEIEFTSAPILLNSNNLVALIPDISSNAKREDEHAEELKLQKESNDYWNSINDDDDY